jgi:hypothetical protein
MASSLGILGSGEWRLSYRWSWRMRTVAKCSGCGDVAVERGCTWPDESHPSFPGFPAAPLYLRKEIGLLATDL